MRKIVFLLPIALLFLLNAQAQRGGKAKKKPTFDSTILLNNTNDTLTQSDYLRAIKKLINTQNRILIITSRFSNYDNIKQKLGDIDTILALINERISGANDRTLNLQNLNMYLKLLNQMKGDLDDMDSTLDDYHGDLDGSRDDLLAARNDSVLVQIFKDAKIRSSVLPQIIEAQNKWHSTDSLLSNNSNIVNNLEVKSSADNIKVDELNFKIHELIQIAAAKAFTKERRYLWENNNRSNNPNRKFNPTVFKRRFAIEKQITAYYFKVTANNIYTLLIFGAILFLWIWMNYRSLKSRKKIDIIHRLHFKYISPLPVLSSLLFLLVLAPISDINAPTLYLEIIEIILLLTLTAYLTKLLSRFELMLWSTYCLLYFSLPIYRLMGFPMYFERWIMFYISLASVAFGLFILIKEHKRIFKFRYLYLSGILYVLLHALSMLCNAFGRVTLANILMHAAVYSLTLSIALYIFIQMMTEVLLLQITSSRIRKNFPENFDTLNVTKGIYKMLSIIAAIIWCIAFVNYLSLYNFLLWKIHFILAIPRSVGNFSFTIGGVILFIGIIWVANFLQKNIAYFFGDMGDDFMVENKAQRSRLLITRLILIIVGFFIAVAASGLPLDKITIILGALSVGIGLGLQNVVNNFVSGIILIFDRTLRIGDVVEVSDKKGRVKEIGIRASTLLTDDGAEIIIPNGDIISKNIVNWTLTNNRIRISFNINITKPYNLEEVYSICSKQILSNPGVYTAKKPEIFITAITAVSSTLKINYWCNSITNVENTNSTVYAEVCKALEEKGIKII